MMISWSMNYRWRGSGLWGKFRRRWGGKLEGTVSFSRFLTSEHFRKIGLISVRKKNSMERKFWSMLDIKSKIFRILEESYIGLVKRRKIIGVELFAQTFDSKRNRVFLSSMSSRLFSIEKKRWGRGWGKRRKLVFPVPFQSYKKTFVINK